MGILKDQEKTDYAEAFNSSLLFNAKADLKSYSETISFLP